MSNPAEHFAIERTGAACEQSAQYLNESALECGPSLPEPRRSIPHHSSSGSHNEPTFGMLGGGWAT
jgi:hypothetical protein